MSEEINRAFLRGLLSTTNKWRNYTAPLHKATYMINEIKTLMHDNGISGVKYMCMREKYSREKSWMFVFPEHVDMNVWDAVIHKRFPYLNMKEVDDFMEPLNSGVPIKCTLK